MRKLILAATLAAAIPGFQGAALAQGTITAPAKPGLAGTTQTQTERQKFEQRLFVAAFSVALDRKWDFLAVTPFNELFRVVEGIKEHGMAPLGISVAEARAIAERGRVAADNFASVNAKESRAGQEMIRMIKNLFEH